MADRDVKADEKVISKMLQRFKLSAEAEASNRRVGLQCIKFTMGGEDQWDRNVWSLRKSDNRPSESYNQIPQFVHQVTNDMRMNMPQVRFVAGEDATKEMAEVREDLVRNIQSQSDAEVAFDTAAFGQVVMGWGYFRITTEYENKKSFDQIIKISEVSNPFQIYDDPFTLLQDRSDRKYLIQVSDMAIEEFNSTHNREYGSLELSSIGDSAPDWATEETVRIAEYWTVEETTTKLYLTADGKTHKDKPKNYEKERDVTTCKVKWRKCTAMEVLEESDWAGEYIPYVFVPGEEINIDGKKVYRGLVQGLMSSQQQYNYWMNAATEMVALAPKAPYMVAIGQLEGLETIWDQANTKNYPYLPYKPTDVKGNLVGAPQRQQAEPPIQAMMSMVQSAQQNMYTTSGIYPASLGKQGNETSGKAINARKVEGETSNFHFPDNFARSLRCAGRMLDDLIPKIYDAARTVGLLKEDKSFRTVKINQKFKDDDGETKEFNMDAGTYGIMVTTGPSYTSKREAMADSMTQVVQAYPELMAIAGDLVIGSYDWPGAEKLAERIKKTLPPNLADEPKKGEVPPQVQVQMEQMGQIIEQLQGQLQQVGQELQSKEADIANKQADLQLKQQDMQLKAQDQQYSAQADQLKAENDRMKIQLDAEKLEWEKEKTQYEWAKAQLESFKNEMNDPQPVEGEEMQDENTLLAQLEAVRNQKSLKEQAELQAQIDAQTQAERAEMKEAEDRARSDALLQGLSGIQEMIMGLTASIAAPKQVIRNPETGLIEGVTTVGTIQ